MANEAKDKSSLLCSVRFLVVLLLFLGATVQYTHKTDISIGIICMINNSAINQTNQVNNNELYKSNDVQCKIHNESKQKDPDGPFTWNKDLQETALAGYFYGYVTTQIPGGILASKFGPKAVLFFSLLLGSVFTLLAPLCANWNFYAFLACRILTGIVQGPIFPAFMLMYNYWIPLNERGRLLGLGYAGITTGTIIGFSVGGLLCVHGGWASLFYYFGAAGLVWCLLWFLLTSDKPETHSFISTKEKAYIKDSLPQTTTSVLELRAVPWRKILFSRSCLALYANHFSGSWSGLLFLTNVPIYLSEVLKFDIQSNGLISALPYFLTILVTIIAGFIGDLLIERKTFRHTTVRKMFTAISSFISAILILALSFVKCDKPYLGVAILTIGISIGGLSAGGGSGLSYIEVSGPYVGIMFSICNTIGQITGILVPHFLAIITKNKTQEEWAIVFVVTACVVIAGSLVFIIFGSSEREPWAVIHETNSKIIQNGTINANYSEDLN